MQLNTISDDINQRLRFKTISTILIGIVLTILFGILLYLLPIFIQMEATIWVILLLFFIVGLPSSYFLKTPKLFSLNAIIAALSPLVAVFLNNIYPKHELLNLPSSIVYVLLLSILFLFTDILAILPIIRICIGYETHYDPVVYSYVTGGVDNDFLKRFKNLITLIGAISITSYKFKNPVSNVFDFVYMKDRYLAYLRSRDNNTTELDFLTFRLKRDTIIPPESDDVALFLSLFDTAAGKWNEQRKITNIGKEKNPVFSHEAKNYFVSSYTSPVRLPITIPHPRTSAIKSWVEKHTVIIGFVGGIIASVIASLILRYIFGI